MKKILIFVLILFILLIPLTAIIFPTVLIGNFFTNAWGNVKDFFGLEYEGNMSEDIDNYMFANRISLNYQQLSACVLADSNSNPKKCLENHDEIGNILTENASKDYFSFDWQEQNGLIDDEFYKDIHVLGKYTVSKWEVIGQHEETYQIKECQTKVDSGHRYTQACELVEKTRLVDDYGWVYYPTLKRGKCQNSPTLSCQIILEDKDTYPYIAPSFTLAARYGIQVNSESFDISSNNYQIWQGDILYAFSKGEVIEKNSSSIILRIIANDIDLYAKYESAEENTISSDFYVGDIVEAGEELARNEIGETKFSLYNTNNEYINPYIFIGNTENFNYSGLGSGSIIAGYEDFTPDFSQKENWLGRKQGGLNNYGDNFMGQCTWFAKGLFLQHYGYDPQFTGDGKNCANQAYIKLKDQGWTLSKTPAVGAIFSTVNFNHVGIVCGIIDEDTMIIIEGNFNHKNDTLEEFISLPDWAMNTVSTHYYKKGATYIFCNPPQN